MADKPKSFPFVIFDQGYQFTENFRNIAAVNLVNNQNIRLAANFFARMLQNDGNQLFRINHVVIFPAFVPGSVKTINGLLRKIPVVYFRNFNILPRIQPLHAAKMAVADFAVLVIPVFAGILPTARNFRLPLAIITTSPILIRSLNISRALLPHLSSIIEKSSAQLQFEKSLSLLYPRATTLCPMQ